MQLEFECNECDWKLNVTGFDWKLNAIGNWMWLDLTENRMRHIRLEFECDWMQLDWMRVDFGCDWILNATGIWMWLDVTGYWCLCKLKKLAKHLCPCCLYHNNIPNKLQYISPTLLPCFCSPLLPLSSTSAHSCICSHSYNKFVMVWMETGVLWNRSDWSGRFGYVDTWGHFTNVNKLSSHKGFEYSGVRFSINKFVKTRRN